jgi:RNA 3'-terminal phosphate cyclase (ATP)
MTDQISIDGSRGEGGGQILRTSLALSLVTGRPVTIGGIRAGRAKPGLMRQHLTAVNAAVEISGAQAAGAAVGSRTLSFAPGAVRAGEYRFSVGTAGSATLVLQTILPALLLADGPTTLVLEGGTHNPWAPPFDFLQEAYLPLINRMGPQVTAELDQAGFYPAGGGRFRVQIQPARELAGFDLCDRGEFVSRQARVLLSKLPEHIAHRELETVRDKLGWDEATCAIVPVRSVGPGNALVLTINSEHVTEVFCGFGREGVAAEHVARDVVKEVRTYLKANVPVGPYLADQLMLPLGISAMVRDTSSQTPRGGTYRTVSLTRHSTTHIDLLREFLAVRIDVEKHTGGAYTVRIAPGNDSPNL